MFSNFLSIIHFRLSAVNTLSSKFTRHKLRIIARIAFYITGDSKGISCDIKSAMQSESSSCTALFIY